MPNPNQLQHWSRTQTISGEEQISAILRADFAAQQLATTLHLPFCPPFSAPPQVSILSLDNKENASEKLTCHTTRILPAGARIDLKRTQKDSAQHWIAVEIKGR